MPEFIPDTDGQVLGQPFDDLRPFTQGYIKAMLWLSVANGYSMVEWHSEETQEAVREGQAGGTIPEDSGYSDIHPDSMMAIHNDCSAFRRDNARWLSMAEARGYSEERAGHDFWLTRNRHGAGFWDRKELEADNLGESLSEAAQAFGEVDAWFSEAPEEESPTGYGFVYLE